MTAPVLDRPQPVRLAPRRSGRRARILRAVAIVLVIAIIVGAVWAVWFSSLLTARQVRVVGVEGARADAALAAAAVPIGRPLARIDTQQAQAAVVALPWVAAADVRRGWPSEVVVAVTAREPIAVLSSQSAADVAGSAGTTGRQVVDADGVVFEPAGAPAKGLPRVTATGAALAEAMRVLVELPPDLSRRVVSVEATTRDDVTLRLRSGDQVRWGSAEEGAFKAEVLRTLLTRKADMYDVSAPQMPTTFRAR